MDNEIKSKLNYLIDTKQLFKTVLKRNGAPITDATPLREYANYFGSVEEGDDSKINAENIAIMQTMDGIDLVIGGGIAPTEEEYIQANANIQYWGNIILHGGVDG